MTTVEAGSSIDLRFLCVQQEQKENGFINSLIDFNLKGKLAHTEREVAKG